MVSWGSIQAFRIRPWFLDLIGTLGPAMSDDYSQPHRLTLTHIFHPTDLGLSPEVAFSHALKLTLATKGKLTVKSGWIIRSP